MLIAIVGVATADGLYQRKIAATSGIFYMDDENLLKITDAGKRRLALLVDTYKAKLGNPDWFIFTDHVIQVSGVRTTKDIFYRTCQGNYIKTPDPVALAALSKAKDFTFINSPHHPDLDAILDILLGLLDVEGNPIPQGANLDHHSVNG